MASESVTAFGEMLEKNTQKAFVSMVQFSSACMLFGVERLQTALSFEAGYGIPKAMEDLESALNSMADSLSENLAQNNRAAVDTASRIAERVVQQSLDTLTAVDPRKIIDAAGRFIRKAGDSGSEDETERADDDQPQLAADALVGPEE
jgi:hypothetical protein